MVPTVFIRIDSFPTTPNGKLDRRALPAPDLGTLSTGGRAPGTDTEKLLAGVFRDVLNLPDTTVLSVDDDFFRLGGHSLLATRVIARINADTGAGLSLRDVFDAPTIAGLGERIDRVTGDGSGVGSSVLRVGDVKRPDVVPASFGQQSLWLIDQLGGPKNQYVVPTVLHLTGDLDITALRQAVHDVVARHEALRTLLVDVDGQVTQQIIPAADAAARLRMDVEDFTDADRYTINTRADAFIRAGFDLATDIPIRAALMHTGIREWVLALAVHHHAVDEWSFPSLLG
ncbi:non-ribosomal peptide synthetase, partial [Brevibacterium aurantiacum]